MTDFISNIQPWLVWAIAAVVLMLGEMFIPGFFIFFFGAAAIPAAIAAALGASPLVQLIVFAVFSAIGLVFARKIALRLTEKSPQNIGANRMQGKCGMVTEPIGANNELGKVRVDRDVWIAESENGEAIEEGARVDVIRIDGARLIVKIAE